MLRDACLYLLALASVSNVAPVYGDSPQAAVTRFMADVSKKPPGPAENDVTSEGAAQYAKTKKDRASLGDMRSFRDTIAETYDTCALESPLTVLYSEGAGALYYSRAQLTPAEIAECKDEASNSAAVMVGDKVLSTEQGSPPMFGESGVFTAYVGSKVPDDGKVIATFCLVRQKGRWKVHCLYFSNDVLAGSDKDFVVKHLADLAKKQEND